MPDEKAIFAANREWARAMCESEPGFFDRLVNQQEPEYLWIGCSDSRVPASQITGLRPGEVFVHRNIANIVPIDDLNCQAVIQYAVDVLGVKCIVVCGHYGCGGVLAALRGKATGLTGDWISSIVALREQHASDLAALATETERHDRLCELNVIEQVRCLSESEVIKTAWSRGQALQIHAWIYSIKDGLLKNLNTSVGGPIGV
ncbi:MAG: carbonic anhydrase [Gammaproteobacteria bacterium]|jgi:carbonic anhydrase|nr:carbonic anhydrase [Chromatiales bacterium]MDP6414083.1 carbonic anhydrase [Gammaproteobacteria bacterium]MDP6673598.1 carbonic anhydrase [Gammaproteobacteria bacterium]